jgi:threonine dehydrogenase-like Zn-dependent dehydrogenase
MGHEYCGIVEEVGPAVQLVKPGQFVSPLQETISPIYITI